MNYRRKKNSTHKKQYNKKNKRYTHKNRNIRGGEMTTSVDTNPISYKEDEYKEMNELAFRGGQNTDTPESQGPMTLDELNISNIDSENNTNDQLDENDISGFAQNPDEEWEQQMNILLQQNTNPLTDEDAYTEMESYPSFGSQNTTSSFPSSDISSITNNTTNSDISMGGKKKRRVSRKKTINNKKRITRKKTKTNRRYKK